MAVAYTHLCLRYEQEAYEDLLKHGPKNGAFVQTEDGYGSVTLVNLLRQNVKVKLDGPGEAQIRTYDADEIAEIPGGRPAEGQPLPDLLRNKPKKVKEENAEPETNGWIMPSTVSYTHLDVYKRQSTPRRFPARAA